MTAFADRARTAVVVPIHNGLRLTLELLESLSALEGPAVMLVIVDDGSTDGSADRIAEVYPDALIVPAGGLWWTGAVDLGCRFAIQRGAERLLLIPNDQIAAPSMTVELNRLLDGGAGLVSAVCLDRPADDGGLTESVGTLDWAGRGIGLRHLTPDEIAAGVAYGDWLSGMCMMFDASLYRELGGFDPKHFPHYRGDVDFSLRARRRGHSCVVTTRTWIYASPDQTWIDFRRPVPLTEFLRGFWTYRSDYNLRETLRFAARFCPPRLIPFYLAQFYARWVFVFLKTHWPALGRLAISNLRR